MDSHEWHRADAAVAHSFQSRRSGEDAIEDAKPVNAADPRVIVALDFPDMLSAFGLAARLDPALCAV
jgi:hypothetical protein